MYNAVGIDVSKGKSTVAVLQPGGTVIRKPFDAVSYTHLDVYKRQGKDAVEMKPGDCINIPAEVKHWHGAAPDEWFSHLAIEVPGENGSNEWLEPVSDEEYGKLK